MSNGENDSNAIKCGGCGGNGICKRCNGNGTIEKDGPGTDITCPRCRGTTICPGCHGSGWIITR